MTRNGLGANSPFTSLHLQLLARIERVAECRIDHVEHTARVGDADADTLFEAVDR